MQPAAMTIEKLNSALAAEFPQMFGRGGLYVIEALHHGAATVRRRYHENSLRPGGTLVGTSMMELADVGMYIALLGAIGWVPLAVTTSLNINFLRKPTQRDLVAEVKLMKLGKRLAIGDIAIRSDGQGDLVAHATATYSIPRKD
jgi:uncharacterized protein (TIGR00369 family)